MTYKGLFINTDNTENAAVWQRIGNIYGAGVVGQVAEFVTDTEKLQAAKLIAPTDNILTLTNAAASTLALNITAAKTLTLTAVDDYTLTIPATGTATLGTGTANYVTYWSGTNTVTGAATLTYNPSASPNLFLQSANAAHVPYWIQLAASQSADAFRVVKSDGTTVLSGVDERGILFSNGGTAVSNLFIGDNAGNISASGGDGNLGFGQLALSSLTSGTRNLAIGSSSLKAVQNGSYNVAVGRGGLEKVTSGFYNVSIGESALNSVLTTSYNIGIGWNAGVQTTGSSNVLIGAQAGSSLVGGSSNIFIGFRAGLFQTGSNLFIIDNVLRADAATELTNSILYGVMAAAPASQTLRINAVETVAVNTTTTNAALTVLDLNAYVSTASTGFAAGGGVGMTFTAETATDGTSQLQALIASSWVDATNATRKAKLSLSAYDTAVRLGLEIEATGSDVTLLALGKLAFTQTDLNEYIDSLADGYMDLSATTAVRINNSTADTDVVLQFVGTTSTGTFTWMEDESYLTRDFVTRATTSLYRRYYHLPVDSFDPGAAGATWTNPTANNLSGWQLNAVGETLNFEADVHSDWDGATDLTVEISFQLLDAGSNLDTVDLKLVCYYMGNGDTATKTQTQEVATVTDGTQYKMYTATFTINFDETDNVVDAGDRISFVLNLETDTSEIDNILIVDGSFYYQTTHTYVEAGDV